ncbi:MAG: xylulokinase, partial [Clostridia bacterium]|nr:xylulokinase [Clostridia bacterium]
MQKLLTFDVGTTAMKCILFDENFNQLFFARCEYDITTPSESIAELDPEIYFNTFLECVNKMRDSGIDIREISSITFTTQGETLIPVDRDGRPLTSAIVWLDTRAEREAEDLRELIGDEEIYRHTGLWGIDGALTAAKVLWLSKNKPEIYERL